MNRLCMQQYVGGPRKANWLFVFYLLFLESSRCGVRVLENTRRVPLFVCQPALVVHKG